MKIKKTIIADLEEGTNVITTNVYHAIYKTPNGRIEGKMYLTRKAVLEEVRIYAELLNYKLSYIHIDLVFMR